MIETTALALILTAAPKTQMIDFPPSQMPTTVPAATSAAPAPFPPPPPAGVYRGATLSLSVGPGWLALRDDLGRDGQKATGFAGRLGVVLDPRWVASVSADHTRTTRGSSTFSQTALLFGVHRVLLERLYLGGGFGLSWVRATGPLSASDGPGWAYSASVGVEALRGEFVALTMEAAFTMGHYQAERWEMGGLRAGLLIF